MQQPSVRNWRLNDFLLSSGVLFFLLAYTYGILFLAPFMGFYFDPSTGEVLEVYETGSTGLQKGDILERVGSFSLDDFHADRNLNWFEGIKPGETIELGILRNGTATNIDWVYPGFTWEEFGTHLLNIWWLAYVFWAIGTITQLSLRPKDARWRLFIAMNYLMAMFVMLGAISTFQIMWSATLLRVAAWLLLPVYLHFHWIFPMPVKAVPRWLLVLVYAACFVLAAGEVFQRLPRTAYFIAVALAFLGSIFFLLMHFIFQREHRREVGFLAAAAGLSMSLAILIGISGGSGNIPQSAPLSLFALPILPAAYFYVSYRHRLGGLELRTNRTISLYLFFVILVTLLLWVLGYSDLIDIRRETIVFAIVTIAVTVAGISILTFPAFQAFVERRILGVRLPGLGLAETYSARIVASHNLADLTRLLDNEVFPSLFIRQYAVIRNVNPSAVVMLSGEVTSEQIPMDALADWFVASAVAGRFPPADDPAFEWVRLALPMQVGPNRIGIWLLGRRDPDDHYPQAELPILRSLANQTAIALSNIIQSERLKAMYHANITRYEQERNRLGRDLHDGVLNEMAAILNQYEGLSQVRGFEESFTRLIQQIREIVSDLRPPSLLYGLKFAFEGLADNLSQRNQDRIRIVAEIKEAGLYRYPEVVENNLYRIVQEACENALKYSQANSIIISGELREEEIDLDVADDGIGFNAEINLPLDDMVANKHFGLAGMLERAELIGAAVRINSRPGQGTQIRVAWGGR